MENFTATPNYPFIPSSQMSALVNAEIEQDGHYHPNLGGVTIGGMSNHFPMTILSLHELGASDAEIQQFKKVWPRYRALSQEDLGLSDHQEVNAENWTEHLGNSDSLLEFKRVFYEGLVSSENVHQYTIEALNKMDLSLPMGLYHPVIRLSFALIHGDKGSIADALAYMAIRYFPLFKERVSPKIEEKGKQLKGEDVWLHASKHFSSIQWAQTIGGGSLRICEQLCAEPGLHHHAFPAGFTIQAKNLEERMAEICLAALKLYHHQPALTTLHAVTASQALAAITQWGIEAGVDKEHYIHLWNHHWVWLTGLFFEKGFPTPLPQLDPAVKMDLSEITWDQLAAEARQIPEVHLIKMVYSCKWLDENTESNLLYKLAALKVIQGRNAHARSGYGLI